MSDESIDGAVRGQPSARIVPRRSGVLAQLVQDGRATEAVEDLLDLADQLGLPAAQSGAELPSAALAEIRVDEQ